jgi:hypothetical protein
MRIKLFWLLLAAMSVIPGLVKGQADSMKSCINYCCCGPTDLTPSGVMISHIHRKKQLMLSYRYMNMNMGGMLDGTSKVSDDKIFQNYLMSMHAMRMEMHMLMAMYGLSNRITLMGMLNYNVSSMKMSMLPGSMHMHSMAGMNMGSGEMDMDLKSSGIGDVKLNALYGIINEKHHHLLASMGFSIPVGSIEIKGNSNSMYPNQRIPYNMQLGSGTWDLLPGISYLYQNNKIVFSSQITSVVRTGYNAVGYKLGNEVTFNNWLAFQWSRNFSSSLRIEGSTAGSIQGQDVSLYNGNEPAADPANYGGQRISSFIGTNFYFRKGILKNNKIGAEYGLPVYQNLNGPQTSVKSSLYASWSLMF